jgi:hypothetical protein
VKLGADYLPSPGLSFYASPTEGMGKNDCAGVAEMACDMKNKRTSCCGICGQSYEITRYSCEVYPGWLEKLSVSSNFTRGRNMTGAEGLGSAASSYFAQESRSISALQVPKGFSGGEGVGGTGQSSAQISSAGQLFSQLQQLQAQNPTAFTQVTSQIAQQLQSAAQQQGQTSVGYFLSSLASKFQSVASGGSLSQLLPQSPSTGSLQAYSQGGQNQTANLLGRVGPSGISQTGGSSIQHLFASISNEVSQALGG